MVEEGRQKEATVEIIVLISNLLLLSGYLFIYFNGRRSLLFYLVKVFPS